MSNSITKVHESGVEVQRTEQSSDNDSIMLKQDAKGVMAWEIKVYCKLNTAVGASRAIEDLEHIQDMLKLRYG